MTDNKIELRSEKVRHIIGEIPSRFVSYGITVIAIVILGLLVSAYFIPYPETISAKVKTIDDHHALLSIPYKYVNKIKKGETVSIEFEGYDVDTYGVASGSIIAISRTPQQSTTGSKFTVQVGIKDCKYKIISGMIGTASILINNESILEKTIFRIKKDL